MKNKKVSANYLDYIPVHNPAHDSKTDEAGNVTIIIENKGLFNKIAQLIFKKPRFSQVHLEEMGSFIWQQIDGERTVLDISVLVKEEFGEKAEPLLERLCTYVKMLANWKFVIL